MRVLTQTLTFRRIHANGYLQTISFSSSTISENSSIRKSKSTIPNALYSWGTSAKGTIPIKKVLDEATKGKSGTSILSMGGSSPTIIDHPNKIDWYESFGLAKDSTNFIQSVVCGPTATAVLLSDHTCFTFGDNSSGQLGHGHKNDILIPTKLQLPDSTSLVSNEIRTVALGQYFSAFIDIKGDLYTCGYNGSVMAEGVGCLGHGYIPSEYLYTPTLVQSLVEDGCYVSQVTVGNAHMTVLTTEGEVLTCGAGSYGRCGNFESLDQVFLEPVELLAGERDVVQIAGGKDFTLALKKDGIVFAWGRNDKGQCGTGTGLAVDMYAMELLPSPVEGLLEGRKVVKVSAGSNHAAAITDNGELFLWGMGQYFQPEYISELGHTKVVDVSCGNNYTLAVGEDGKLYSFGKGKTGVLGLASDKAAVIPTVVEGLLGREIISVSAGWSHVACLVQENPELT